MYANFHFSPPPRRWKKCATANLVQQSFANNPRLRTFAWAELIWVLAFGPGMLLPGRFLPSSWQPLLVGLLFLPRIVNMILAWRAAAKPRRILAPYSPLTLPIVFMLLWMAFTLAIWSALPIIWGVASYVAWGMALYAALAHWPLAQAEPAWIAWFYLVAGCGVALVTIPIVAWKPAFRLFRLPLYDWLDKVHLDIGESIHANILAGMLVIVLPVLWALLLQTNPTPNILGSEQGPPGRAIAVAF